MKSRERDVQRWRKRRWRCWSTELCPAKTDGVAWLLNVNTCSKVCILNSSSTHSRPEQRLDRSSLFTAKPPGFSATLGQSCLCKVINASQKFRGKRGKPSYTFYQNIHYWICRILHHPSFLTTSKLFFGCYYIRKKNIWQRRKRTWPTATGWTRVFALPYHVIGTCNRNATHRLIEVIKGKTIQRRKKQIE